MTAYLLDTNALLWLNFDHGVLRPAALGVLQESMLFVSVISAVEIAIKTSIGKLALPAPFAADFSVAFSALLSRAAIDVVPLDLPVVGRLRGLPLHHRDPFDRIIIAQALEHDLTIATRDRSFRAYEGLQVLEV